MTASLLFSSDPKTDLIERLRASSRPTADIVSILSLAASTGTGGATLRETFDAGASNPITGVHSVCVTHASTVGFFVAFSNLDSTAFDGTIGLTAGTIAKDGGGEAVYIPPTTATVGGGFTQPPCIAFNPDKSYRYMHIVARGGKTDTAPINAVVHLHLASATTIKTATQNVFATVEVADPS